MIVDLLSFGDPRLRMRAKDVGSFDSSLRSFAMDLLDTMLQHSCIGFAAPQLGKLIRLCIVSAEISKEEKGEARFFINPRVRIINSRKTQDIEANPVLPGISCMLSRPSVIEVDAFDLDGKAFSSVLEGLEARVFLHENDHLNGILFIDRATKKEKARIKQELLRLEKSWKPS